VGSSHRFTFGNYSLRFAAGQGRSDDEDREVGLTSGHDVVRVGGRHLTLSLRHRSWDDLTDAERWARLHEHL
jgi:hypothetical protein